MSISLKEKQALLQGELADLALYRQLRKKAKGEFADILDGFIATETRHAAFWRKHFSLQIEKPNIHGRLRNVLICSLVAVFGESIGYIFLEAVETHGIRHYLRLWKSLEDEETKEALREILTEEFLHEDEAATGGKKAISADVVRNAFLGFNDGSVEILGAVNGLVAALGDPKLVAGSALAVSVAGALSMAAGAFLSTHAEKEVLDTNRMKAGFLKEAISEDQPASPVKSALIVGIGYVVGASVPVAPFLFGATHSLWSILLSGVLILAVSAFLAFMSGMNIARRIGLNIVIIIIAVVVSYTFGTLLEQTFLIK